MNVRASLTPITRTAAVVRGRGMRDAFWAVLTGHASFVAQLPRTIINTWGGANKTAERQA